MHKQILKIIAVVISIYGLMLFAACTPVVIEAPTPNEPTTNAFPDLRVAITAPASAVAGSDIGPQLTIQVRNDGNGIAFGTQSAGSNGYMVDVVLSRDTSIPEGWATYTASYQEDVLLKGGRISNTVDLSPRQSSRYEVGGGIPADTPPGVYFICAKVDAGNTIGELREDNNVACARIRITAAPTSQLPTGPPQEPARRPDLRVAITAPASAVAGSDIGPQLTIQVRNDGNGIAFGTQSAGSNGYMVDVVLSRDTSIPEGWATYTASYQEDVLLKGGRISNTVDLSPRQSSRYEVGGGIPADTPPGVYFICAKVDAGNTIGELREDNNVACARIRITAAPTSQLPTGPPPGLPPGLPLPTKVPTEEPTEQDCVSFNPQTASIVTVRGSWKIIDGRHWLFDFGQKKTEAEQALRIIKHYGMNQSCFVGRPQPSFQYLLVSGNTPVGSMPGEDCVAFNPQTTTVQSINGQWKIVDGNHWLFDFGDNRSEAMMALEIIKRHGFTQSCFVGRPNASFTYLRK
jgi:hypothetical protein